jgi:demethylmenaquinone methyltransferase/2-methoxy-6-polyprenyl-1,4-benzoquinol methylase
MTTDAHAKRPETIKKMFGAVAPKYDLANSVLSLGIHHLWRKKLVRLSGVKAGDRVLDCATGTGDLAFEFESAAATVTATDFSEEMLVQARQKAGAAGSRVAFSVADVMQLPFEDAAFETATISFGIRNVADPKRGLSELGRVVKKGGSVLVLEFGQPTLPGFAGLYRFYSSWILPKIGGWVTGQPQAYDYLQKSSARFPCGEEFLALARSTGMFTASECHSVSGGIAYIYKLAR